MARSSRKLTQHAPGVWTRTGPDGAPLCKVGLCTEPPASMKPRERGMCVKHFQSYPDGRPKCKQCRARYSIEPWAEQLCDGCSPLTQETTPFESHVLASLRDGSALAPAVRNALGPEASTSQVARAVTKLSRSARIAKRLKHAMAAHGATDEVAFARLARNIEAKKQIFSEDGAFIAEVDDVRGSNQALTLYFKLRGHFPNKQQSDAGKQAPVNVAIAMLPPQEARRPDAPIYVLPHTDDGSESGGRDE